MAQTAKPGEQSAPKAIDVVAPGKTPPSPSSKPIIVTNRPIIKDPMAPTPMKSVSGALHPTINVSAPITSTLLMPTGDNPAQTATSVQLPGKRTMKSIPVSSDNSAAGADPDSPANTAAEPAAESEDAQPQNAASDVPPAKPDIPEPAQEDKAPSEASGSSDVPLADNAKQLAEKEQAARLAEEEKIIASKQYNLAISDPDKQRSNIRALVWLLLAVAAVLVWLDLVLDAGVVHIGGVHALTHFFNS